MFNSQLSKARHAVARCYEPFCPRDFAFKLKKSSYAGSYLPRTGFANHLETLPKMLTFCPCLKLQKTKSMFWKKMYTVAVFRNMIIDSSQKVALGTKPGSLASVIS